MSSYGKSNLLNAMVTEDTIITQKNSQALLGEVREEKRKEICVLQRNMDVKATLAIGAIKGNGDVCFVEERGGEGNIGRTLHL